MVGLDAYDSHSVFWGKQTDFGNPVSMVEDVPEILWIGPAKIWGLGNKTSNKTKEKFEEVKQRFIQDTSSVPIACLGEIDIRINLSRLILLTRDISIIDSLVLLYLDKLSELPNEKIVIWGPTPARPDEDTIGMSMEFPRIGSCISRNSITHLFNKSILRQINNYPKIKFITLFYDLVTQDMNTKTGSLSDGYHLSIEHYSSARKLLDIVLNTEVKFSFNIEIMKSIEEIKWSLSTITKPDFSYVACYQFIGDFSFEYFSPIKYNSSSYSIKEINLTPDSASEPLKKYQNIGDLAFMEIFFRGDCLDSFVEFLKMYEIFKTDIPTDHFDTHFFDGKIFEVLAKRHIKKMLNNFSRLHGHDSKNNLVNTERMKNFLSNENYSYQDAR